MKKYGFEDTSYGKMDFANEYGFKSHKCAKKLYNNLLII